MSAYFLTSAIKSKVARELENIMQFRTCPLSAEQDDSLKFSNFSSSCLSSKET